MYDDDDEDDESAAFEWSLWHRAQNLAWKASQGCYEGCSRQTGLGIVQALNEQEFTDGEVAVYVRVLDEARKAEAACKWD